MDLDQSLLKMATSIREISITDFCMVVENFCGLMAFYMKVSSKITELLAKVSTNGLMAVSTKVK
jgi:hypothetical protein